MTEGLKRVMENSIWLAIGILLMYFTAPYLYKSEPEIVDRIVYKTKWKVKPETTTFEQALGCLESPIVIEDSIKGEWITIKAHDNCKDSQIDIRIKGQAKGNWQTYATVGGLCLAGGVVATLYLLK